MKRFCRILGALMLCAGVELGFCWIQNAQEQGVGFALMFVGLVTIAESLVVYPAKPHQNLPQPVNIKHK